METSNQLKLELLNAKILVLEKEIELLKLQTENMKSKGPSTAVLLTLINNLARMQGHTLEEIAEYETSNENSSKTGQLPGKEVSPEATVPFITSISISKSTLAEDQKEVEGQKEPPKEKKRSSKAKKKTAKATGPVKTFFHHGTETFCLRCEKATTKGIGQCNTCNKLCYCHKCEKIFAKSEPETDTIQCMACRINKWRQCPCSEKASIRLSLACCGEQCGKRGCSLCLMTWNGKYYCPYCWAQEPKT